MDNKQRKTIEDFRELHQSGCFILPNPWDRGSALYLQHLGFKALATTSAGFAFSIGLPDDPEVVPLEVMLEHFRDLSSATSLPVNADFQNGFADEPEAVAVNVQKCVDTGVAGLSIEDTTGRSDRRLYERGLAIERIRAARRAIDESGLPVVLTARCEVWLVQQADAKKISLDRLVAFADAGADCLYAPGVRDLADITEIVNAVAPRPVNVLVSSPAPDLTLRKLEDVGVRRISVGSALARVAWNFVSAAQEMAEKGTFEGLVGPGFQADLNGLFAK
jgi:2-methylisocitrate lyase-like PEP mutase family enzyme